MKTVKLQDIVESLQQKKQFLYETFGVTRIGIFGSFVQGTQKDTAGNAHAGSDIDLMVIGPNFEQPIKTRKPNRKL
jgi:predicted nucleotidyltransferase